MNKSAPKKKRWILRGLGALVLLALAAALIVPALIDVDTFRPQIQQVLRDSTGWDADLGDVNLSLFRGTLGIAPASLTAPGAGTSKIEIGRIDVKVGILALLQKELRIKSIRLVRPEILLVRPDEATGWVVPIASTTGASQDTEAPVENKSVPAESEPATAMSTEPVGDDSGFTVIVEEVGVRDGRLRLEDRAVTPTMTFEMSGVNSTFFPTDGGISGTLTFGADDGEVRWRGQVGRTIDVTLDGVKTELLQTFLGPDLIHGGGRLSGEVSLKTPFRIEGTLTAEDLTLVAGERPFDDAGLDFVIAPLGLGWQLETLEFHGDGVRLIGGGPLTPALALQLELPPTELDAFMRAAESVLPLPLEVIGPGHVQATILVDQPEGAELTYEASGSLSAGEVRPGDLLPAAKDVQATFALNRAGRVDVEVASGTIAGGPVSGHAVIDSIDPPGRLTFSGGLRDAVFGELLGGLVSEAAPVRGPTGFQAVLGVDLSGEVLDARSLSGHVDFSARELSLPGWDLDRAVRGKLESGAGSGAAGLLKGLLGKDSGKSDLTADEVVDTVKRLIDSLEGTLDMDRWPWGLDDIRLGVGDVASIGTGWFNPEEGTIDFTLTSRLSAEESRKLIRKHSSLKYLTDGSGRVTLPVRIMGSLLEPSIRVDLDKALGNSLLGDDKEKDDVKNLLKGLLERKLRKD